MGRYKSRATRAGEVAENLRKIAAAVQSVVDDNSEAEDEDEKADDEKDSNAAVEAALADLDFSDAESLQEEIESWRDNLSGTNFENGEKYSMLEEAADALSDITSTLQGIDSSDAPEEIVTTLEEAADDLESVEFPGMY